MSKVYVYDNSFINLLSLIFRLFECNVKPDRIKNIDYFPTLLEEVIDLNVEENDSLLDLIANSISSYVLKIIYLVFLSEEENKELIIYYFLLNALKFKKDIIFRRNLKCVREALRISQYVGHEIHKFEGFLRFEELDNDVLYGKIEPINDILYFLSKHFCKRLKNEYFIIEDVKRGMLSIYDKKKFVIIPKSDFEFATTNLSENEMNVQDLWKSFYKTIGISERKNDRCRRNFMPKRYWKYIIEVRDEL